MIRLGSFLVALCMAFLSNAQVPSKKWLLGISADYLRISGVDKSYAAMSMVEPSVSWMLTPRFGFSYAYGISFSSYVGRHQVFDGPDYEPDEVDVSNLQTHKLGALLSLDRKFRKLNHWVRFMFTYYQYDEKGVTPVSGDGLSTGISYFMIKKLGSRANLKILEIGFSYPLDSVADYDLLTFEIGAGIEWKLRVKRQ